MLISPTKTTKDLGVIMASDFSFSEHIQSLVSSVKSLIAWTMRTFYSRSCDCMMTIWKQLIIPKLDYGCQIWNPSNKCDINTLELLQKNFVKRINGISAFNYWEQLKKLGLYSLQRRRERYLIIYLWKILEGIVPNPKPEQLYIKYGVTSRVGRVCNIPVIRNDSRSKLQINSFSFNAAVIFNCLPKDIRNMSGCNSVIFKHALDTFLKSIPDEPQIPGYTICRRAASNSVKDVIHFGDYGEI